MKQQVHQPVGISRLGLVILLVVVSALVLMWRVVDLHVLRKDFLQDQGDARYLREIPVAAHRGMITDRHGEPLAISTPVDSVWVQPSVFTSAQAQWPRLAKMLNIKLAYLKRLIAQRQDKEFVYLKRRINPALAQQVMELRIPGVSLQREYRRYYPMGEVTAHVVGFTNVDDTGQEGLELAYDQWLRGDAGSQRVIKDRLGQVVKHVELVRKSEPGSDLVLSIDRRLQYLAYRELKAQVFKYQARSGSAVILDVVSGEVLAMVNQPSYNPNNRHKLKTSHLRNRAVTDVFEPGSTVKPFTVAAALQSGRFSPASRINTTPGLLRVGRNTIRDIRNYGRIDVSTVIQKSSNVGASKIAMAIPKQSLWQVHTGVGFGDVSGSGFPGEAAGLLTDPSHWRKIELATLAYGYGLSVTPLQLARAYTVLAADGQLRPVNFLLQTRPVAAERVMKQQTARQVRRMLEQVVVEGGTGTRAQIPGYRVAGKTGTVKKVTAGGYSEDRYVSLFVGMAPASQPRLVMAVNISEPRGDVYYGGEVAAPVFSRVMSGALRLLDIPPDDLSREQMRLAALEGRP